MMAKELPLLDQAVAYANSARTTVHNAGAELEQLNFVFPSGTRVVLTWDNVNNNDWIIATQS